MSSLLLLLLLDDCSGGGGFGLITIGGALVVVLDDDALFFLLDGSVRFLLFDGADSSSFVLFNDGSIRIDTFIFLSAEGAASVAGGGVDKASVSAVGSGGFSTSTSKSFSCNSLSCRFVFGGGSSSIEEAIIILIIVCG